MYTAFLRMFGENFEKMFREFILMPPFQIQTEAAQIWLGVFIALVSGLSMKSHDHWCGAHAVIKKVL